MVARNRTALVPHRRGLFWPRWQVLPMIGGCRFQPDAALSRNRLVRPARTGRRRFPSAGISDQTMAEQTRVTGLVTTARNSVGCRWLAGGGNPGPLLPSRGTAAVRSAGNARPRNFHARAWMTSRLTATADSSPSAPIHSGR